MNDPEHARGSTKLNNPSISSQTLTPINMRVQKRGTRGYEEVCFDKITRRIRALCVPCAAITNSLSPAVDAIKVAHQTIKNLYDGITTEELDLISASIAEGFKTTHPDYSILAARILISNLHKTTPATFSECMEQVATGRATAVGESHLGFIRRNARELDAMIDHAADYMFDYLGYKTLEYSYLSKLQFPVLDDSGAPIYMDAAGRPIPASEVIRTVIGTAIRRGDDTCVPLQQKMIKRMVDRPQYVFMRAAIAIHASQGTIDDGYTGVSGDEQLEHIRATYLMMSRGEAIHATPTLFNACSSQQLDSCFLYGTRDCIEEIMKTNSNTAKISKSAGGIGIHYHSVRARGTCIKSTGGEASGIVPQLRIFDATANAFDQGGRRKGAVAIYVEPWHGDILRFLRIKMQHGEEAETARDLYCALWIPDLFKFRVEQDKHWSLFSEDAAPGLSDVYDGMEVCTKCQYCYNPAYSKYILCDPAAPAADCGVAIVPNPAQEACGCNGASAGHTFGRVDAFTQLYSRYESEGRALRVVQARQVEEAIYTMLRDSGMPYICFKDHANRMSNQSNVGTIKSSNLCAEIYEFSSADSYACCTLASINLVRFVSASGEVDREGLIRTTMRLVYNLDNVVSINNYPVPECAPNARELRPIGIGRQGHANVFSKMRVPFISAAAERVDLETSEIICWAAYRASCDLAKARGAYPRFAGSPASRGELCIDLWCQNQRRLGNNVVLPAPVCDWAALRADIAKYGLRNSLLLANMPTVSTSQIIGNNESFEPWHSNIYTKTTLAGRFTIINKDMINHLHAEGLWTPDIKARVIVAEGSLQNIEEIPAPVREIYKTVWEIKQRDIMDRTSRRQAYIDQGQSLNIYASKNNNATLRGVFFRGWELGLKTGSYYTRTRAPGRAMTNVIVPAAAHARDTASICPTDGSCTSCSA